MSNIRISQLPEVTTVQATDITPVVTLGTTSKITIGNLGNSITGVTSSISASYAATASSADNFVVRGDITGSNAVFSGTITAQKLVVQYITSSTEFVTGSTKFGSDLSDTHQFTGSVTIDGNLSLNNSPVVNDSTFLPFSSSVSTRATNLEITGSVLTAASASFAQASGSISNRLTTIEGKYLTTGSNSITGSQFISGSLTVTGSIFAESITGSLQGTASWAISASYARTASYVDASGVIGLNLARISTGSISASVYVGSPVFELNSGSSVFLHVDSTGKLGINTISPEYRLDVSGSGRFSDNVLVTGSVNVTQNITASNALITGTITAQKLVVQTITSSVIYSSGSNIFGNQLTNTQQFTGSVSITGSLTVNSPATFNGKTTANDLTGSLFGTASWAVNAITSSYPFAVTGSTIYTTALQSNVNISQDSSIFIGKDTGAGTSTGLNRKIVAIGLEAGSGSIIDYGEFIGYRAGAVSSVPEAVAIGYEAAWSASNGDGGVYLGLGAGSKSDTFGAVMIGYSAGQQVRKSGFNSPQNSVFIGYLVANNAIQPDRSIFIGNSAGRTSSGLEYNISLGDFAAYNALTSSNAVFIGTSAAAYSKNTNYSNIIGNLAGYTIISSSYSNLVGHCAGYQISGSMHSILIGTGAGRRISGAGIGENNIIIGKNITLENGRKDSINLGGIIFGTGSYAIDSSNYETQPAFSGSANGRIGINQPLPGYTLDVSGSGNYTTGLTVTGSLLAATITGSLLGTSSFATTASYALNVPSNTGFPFTGSADITGSLKVTGSIYFSNYIYGDGSQLSNLPFGKSAVLTQSVANVTWSFNHNLGERFPNINVFDLNGFEIVPGGIEAVNSNNINIYFSVSQSGYAAANVGGRTLSSSYAISASNAVTASYALNAGAGTGFPFSGSAVITGSLLITELTGSGTRLVAATSGGLLVPFNGNMVSGAIGYIHSQSLASSTWQVSHSLGVESPNVTVYNASRVAVVPNTITITSANTLDIGFTAPIGGYASIVDPTSQYEAVVFSSAQVFKYTQSTLATTWNVYHNLDSTAPIVTVYDGANKVMIPQDIAVVDEDNLTITFASPESGSVSIIGNLVYLTGSNALTASYAVTASYSQTALTSSYAYTASYINPITNGYVVLTQVSQSLNYADDIAAAAGGVPLGGLYRNGNFILIRIS